MKGGGAKDIMKELSKSFSNYDWNNARAIKHKGKINLQTRSNIKILIRPNRPFGTTFQDKKDPQWIIERYNEENA